MIETAHMKTKNEAAGYLGISTRQLANYAKNGDLSVQYQRGRTGDVAVYDEKELRKLKAKIDSRHRPRPAVMREEETGSHETLPALASNPSQLPTIQNLLGAIFQGRNGMNESREPTISDLAAKPLLSIAEAQKLTGLSRQTLLDAHHAGKLKLIVIGRGYKVKNKELMRFIDKL
jgi:excisionase family DNA binding protein